jgi:hypothetical protein
MAERAAPDPFRQLKRAYDSRRLVLTLGAGVSVGCGLPDWTRLLRALVRKHVPSPRPSYNALADYFDHNPSVIAGLVRDQFSSRRAFADAIRRELYGTGPFRRFYDRHFERIGRDFVRFVQRTNPTLHAVASLCVDDPSLGRVSSPNPAIRAVVNFNFDAVFRLYVHGRYGPEILRTIERASAQTDPAWLRRFPSRISVYHVHGYLQFLKRGMSQRFEASDLLTFAETDYFDVFDQSGSVFNYTFRFLLREYSMLFIGLSMKDINLRRMLHYSITELRSSYREEAGRGLPPSRVRRHCAVLNSRGLASSMRDYVERDLARFGVRPLWVHGFQEIPEVLGRLRGNGAP